MEFGCDGPFTAAARGLVPATTVSDTVAIDDYNVHVVSVPAGTTYTRFSLFDANSSADSDLDLEVYNSAFTFIGGSGGATSAEEVSFVNLQPGTGGTIHVTYHTDSTALTTDTVTATVYLNTDHLDQTPLDNSDAITADPTTSFDPNEKLVDVAARDGNAAGGLELVVRSVREVLDGHTSSFAVSNVATGRAHTFKDPATKPGREER